MGYPKRFSVLLALVSALLPLSAWLLIRGVQNASFLALSGGVLASAAGLLGLIGLGRIVIVLERRRGRS